MTEICEDRKHANRDGIYSFTKRSVEKANSTHQMVRNATGYPITHAHHLSDVMGIDRLEYSCRELVPGARLPACVRSFLQNTEAACRAEVQIIGTGPANDRCFVTERSRTNVLAEQFEKSQ